MNATRQIAILPGRNLAGPVGVAALLAALLCLGSGAASASGISGSSSRPVLMARIFTSEIPSAAEDPGQFLRIAVIIPPDAEVAAVEAFMDEVDHGRSTGRWRECDLDSGRCEIEGGRVEGLRRLEFPDHGEVLLDFWNDHPSQPRFGKLRVVFRAKGNLRKTYQPSECWLRTECGYAGWMDMTIVDDDQAGK